MYFKHLFIYFRVWILVKMLIIFFFFWWKRWSGIWKRGVAIRAIKFDKELAFIYWSENFTILIFPHFCLLVFRCGRKCFCFSSSENWSISTSKNKFYHFNFVITSTSIELNVLKEKSYRLIFMQNKVYYFIIECFTICLPINFVLLIKNVCFK